MRGQGRSDAKRNCACGLFDAELWRRSTQWIGRSQVLPVFGRKVIEGKQLITVFCEFLRRLRILGRISVNKAVEGRERFFACGGLPDLLQASFGPTMLRFGQSVEYISGLVKPAALVSSLWEHFGQCCPQPHCPI